MESTKILTVTGLLLFLVVSVTTEQGCGQQHVTDLHDDNLRVDLLNPARGFYLDSLTSAKYFHPLTKDHLKCLQDNYGTNLMLRLYSLDTFSDGTAISEDFKNKLEQDFLAAKEAGWNLVLRFMYQNKINTQYNPQSEPSVSQIQEHIKQLAPIIAKYEGVVVAIQAGFHGEFGLWYTPGIDSTQQDTSILNTLLNEIPNTIPIQVAHPDYKTSGFSSMTQLGHYHECLLEGDTNKIKTAFPDLSNNPGHLAYLINDTETSVIGGKTCHPGDTLNPPRNLCPESEKLFKDLHLTYLNAADPDEAIQNYQRNGCFQTIFDKLGYRLTAESVSLPDGVANNPICIGVTLSNRGYASPFRHYNVSFILIDVSDQSVAYETKIMTDTTKWLPGSTVNLTSTFSLLQNVNTTYKVYLKISEPSLENNTDYYILLSNSNLNYENGLNRIGNITVQPSQTSLSVSTTQPWKMPMASTNPRIWTKNSHSCLVLPNGPPTAAAVLTTVVGQTTVQSPQETTLLPPIVPFLNDTSKLEKCKKLETVKALLQFTYVSHPGTLECPNSSSRASPEAIVASFCNAPTNTLLWRPQGRVIDNCDSIPMYSRVGVFSNLNYYDYDTTIRKCGVFLGCLKSGSKVIGVKIGMQLCGRPFDIENAHFANEKDLDRLYVF